MGKSAPSKQFPHGVSKSITNYQLPITNLRRCLAGIVFLGAFCVFNLDIIAQDNSITSEQVILLPFNGIFSQPTTPNNIERKRDALIELRNFQSANASRIAVDALKDSSEIVRATAAFSVIFLPKDEAAQNLIPLLSDKKPLVRREAAYALGKTSNPAAINSLIQIAQKDKVLEVKSACVVALGEIGDVSAVNFLIGILNRKPQTKEEFLRRSAARSIGQIAQIVQTGYATVVTPEKFSNEKAAISPISPPFVKTFPQLVPAVAVLLESLQNSNEFPDVRRETAFALGAIGDKAAISILQNLSAAEDYYLAEIAREALRKISVDSNQKPE